MSAWTRGVSDTSDGSSVNGGAGAAKDNGGHRWGDHGHVELPCGALNSDTCPSTPALMATPVSGSPCPSPLGMGLVQRADSRAPQAGLERWQEGSPQAGWGQLVGQWRRARFTLSPLATPSLHSDPRTQALVPQPALLTGSHALAWQGLPTPPPQAHPTPTDPAG